MMPHKTNLVLLGIGLLAVLAFGLIVGTDTGGVRTKAFLAWDRYERQQNQAPRAKRTAPPVKERRLPNGRRWWPGCPDCGCVFPECETWPPERLEATLDDNPRCEVAYIWVAFAYRKQRNWTAFWATCNEMDEVWPNHHFPKAMRKHRKELQIERLKN